jgi:hypothetical protein
MWHLAAVPPLFRSRRCSQVPDAKRYAKPTRELITEWYPKINAILFGRGREVPLKTVRFIFEPTSYAGYGDSHSEIPAPRGGRHPEVGRENPR